jgi:hypothetical protein
LMTVDFHRVNHGFTPFSSSHFRMDATAPLSMSGEG